MKRKILVLFLVLCLMVPLIPIVPVQAKNEKDPFKIDRNDPKVKRALEKKDFEEITIARRKLEKLMVWSVEKWNGSHWLPTDDTVKIDKRALSLYQSKSDIEFKCKEDGKYSLVLRIQHGDYTVLNATAIQFDYWFASFVYDYSDIFKEGYVIENNYSQPIEIRVHLGAVVNKETVIVDPHIVFTRTGFGYAPGASFQRFLFLAEDLHWVFYSDLTSLLYKYSPDGASWSEPQTVKAAGVTDTSFSMYEQDGTIVYVHRESGVGGDVTYRQGTLEGDGDITWAAAESVAWSSVGNATYTPTITLDVNDKPVIGITADDGNLYSLLLTSHDLDSWNSSGNHTVSTYNNATDAMRVVPTRLENGTVSVIYYAPWAGFFQKIWDGTTLGTEVEIVSGFVDGASETGLDFNGVDQYGNAGNDASLQGMTDLTITAWVNGDEYLAYSSIIASWVAPRIYIFGYFTAGGASKLGKITAYVKNGTVSDALTSVTNLDLDTWYHVAMVFKGGNSLTIYIDGVEDNTKSTTVTNITATPMGQTVRLGLYSTKYLDGSLDEVKIYNRSLSAAEIEDEYDGDPVSTTGLVAYYSFDNAGRAPIVDESGTGNTVTLANFEYHISTLACSTTALANDVQIAFLEDMTDDVRHIRQSSNDFLNYTISTTSDSDTEVTITAHGSTELYAFWFLDQTLYYENFYINSGWGTRTTLIVEDDTMLMTSSFIETSNNTLGVGYFKGSGTDYVYKYQPMILQPPIPADAGVIIAMESGDWMFHMEQYTVTIYAGSGTTDTGIRFDDGVNTYIISYNITASQCEVDEGTEGIKITDYSYTSSSGFITCSIDIYIDDGIYDSYERDLYMRVYNGSETGYWLAQESYINFYKLGGKTEYLSSGYAGHTLGGDAFEIYAADSMAYILIDTYGFDVLDTPITVDWEEDGLLQYLPPSWKVNLPIRTSTVNMYPSNRIPAYTTDAARAYNSYPFGFRIEDQNPKAARALYIEHNFKRSIKTANEELVLFQTYVMSPDVSAKSGKWRLQQRSLFDSGSTSIAADLRMDQASHIDVWNTTSSSWVDIENTNDYQWYNVTVAANLTSQTFDVYVDGNLDCDDMPFVATCTSLNTVFFGNADGTLTSNLIYFDDVRVWTDWASSSYGGKARANMYFRKLQGMEVAIGLGIEDPTGLVHPSNTTFTQGYWEVGLDASFGGIWVNPIVKTRIILIDAVARNTKQYLVFNVTHYQRDTAIVKNETIYCFWEGYGGESDYGTVWLNLWFNQINASSTVGARVSAYYYGMKDVSPWGLGTWRFTRDWHPIQTDLSESMMITDVEDTTGTIRSSREIDMMRVWVEVFREDELVYHYSFEDVKQFELITTKGYMEGIPTPTFNPPKSPDMAPGVFIAGFRMALNSLILYLARLTKPIWEGVTSSLIALMDVVLSGLGFPDAMSNFQTWLGYMWNYISNSMTWLNTFLTSIFSFFGSFMTRFLSFVSKSLGHWVTMINMLYEFLDGTRTAGFNIWTEYQIPTWITIACILYPVWLMALYEGKGRKEFQNHIEFVLGIARFLTQLFMGIANLVINFVSSLIESIPVVE